MSVDGSRFAFARRSARDDRTSDIWLGDTATGRLSQFTFDTGNENASVFSPDGRQLIFNSSKKGNHDLYLRSTDDSTPEIELFADEYDKVPIDWSHDNKYLLYMRSGNRGPGSRAAVSSAPAPVAPGRSARAPFQLQQLWVLPLQGERVPRRMLEEDESQTPGAFSPDGKYIAYTRGVPSPEIFVTPFPATGTKWKISTGGGTNPRWSRDGKELYFTEGASRLMVARVDTTGLALRVLDVGPIFPVQLAGVRGSYWPSTDGKRFLIITPVGTDPRPADPPVIVTNWPMRLAVSGRR
jgi:Tol biopolymer transport system component